MLSLRTVFCPVDFSPATDRQVALAVDLCRAFGARLVLHHNVTSVAVGAGVGWMYAADHPPMSRPKIEAMLHDLQASRPAGVEVDIRITHGPSSHAVLAESEAVEADLVILTTHGETSDDHASITERVLSSGDRAVLALHDAGLERGTPSFSMAPGHTQTFVVPTDLTDESLAAVTLACELARKLPIDLDLVHFVPDSEPPTAATHGKGAETRARMSALIPDDLLARTSMHVERGDAAEGIARVAAELSASCIVMGEHTRAPLRRWFSRDTSRAVLHAAPCPIWYVPGRRHEVLRGPAGSYEVLQGPARS